jgi:hypothetical protein
MDQNRQTPARRENEWNGPWWKHPYAAYLLIVLGLFGFLALMAYFAVENDWIPTR